MSTIDPNVAPDVVHHVELTCPTCEDTGPFWVCTSCRCPVVECSECGQRFNADTGDTDDTTCRTAPSGQG